MTPNPVDETSYRLQGDFLANPAAAALLSSFRLCMALEHKLHPLVAAMQGMSGRKYRYLINNLVEATPDARYLEVGSWAGSTACAAMFRNSLHATCIDNWAEFGGPKEAFLANIEAVKSDGVDFNFIERDFRQVNFAAIGQFNIYLFDGPHEEKDQYDGVVIAQPALDPVYTLIVDDWNWPAVRKGTEAALGATATSVVCSIEVRTTQTDTHPQGAAFENSEWHNGYYFAVCRKGMAESRA